MAGIQMIINQKPDIIFFHKGNICEQSLAKDFFIKPKSKEGRLFIEGKIVV